MMCSCITIPIFDDTYRQFLHMCLCVSYKLCMCASILWFYEYCRDLNTHKYILVTAGPVACCSANRIDFAITVLHWNIQEWRRQNPKCNRRWSALYFFTFFFYCCCYLISRVYALIVCDSHTPIISIGFTLYIFRRRQHVTHKKKYSNNNLYSLSDAYRQNKATID